MATATWTAHTLYKQKRADVMWRGGTAPDSFKHRVRFFAGSLTEESDLATIIAAEITASNYAPPSFVFDQGSYNSTTKAWVTPPRDITWSPSGSNYTWQTAIAWIDGTPDTPHQSISALDHATGNLTVTGHAVTDGDPVMVTADSGGALPSEISGTTIYYGKSIDANTAQLFTDAGLTTQLTFSTNDTLPLRLRYAKGTPAMVADFGTTQTVIAGNTNKLTIACQDISSGTSNGI